MKLMNTLRFGAFVRCCLASLTLASLQAKTYLRQQGEVAQKNHDPGQMPEVIFCLN